MHCLILTRQNIFPVVKKLSKYSQREYLEFIDIAFLASGTWARRAAWWGVVIGQLGVCTSYAIFIANNLHSSIFPKNISRNVVVLSMYPLLLALSFIKTLKKLLPVAALGLILLVVGIVLIFAYGFSKQNKPPFPNTLPMIDVSGIIIMCGISTLPWRASHKYPVYRRI